MISRRGMMARSAGLGFASLFATGGQGLAQVRQPPSILIRNVRIFDGVTARLSNGHVLVSGERIAAVSGSEIAPPDGATLIDGGGRVLMPGLTDAHFHLFMRRAAPRAFRQADAGMLFAAAVVEAENLLMRGITTIRDTAGPVFGIKSAIDEGVIPGPRIFPSGAMISQTSGHGDHGDRLAPSDNMGGPPSDFSLLGYEFVANGVPAVLTAARTQLRKGASQLKFAAGGGVTSDFDPISSLQYSPEEQRAIVAAATDWGTYATAHVYTADGIRRAIDAGVRCIEHGHLADEKTLRLMAEKRVWLSTQAFDADGPASDPKIRAKAARINGAYRELLPMASRVGVNLAYGTDIVMDPDEVSEAPTLARFASALSVAEALRIVTSGNAELFEMAGERNSYRDASLGRIRPRAWADILLVRGDPTQDISILSDPRNIEFVMKSGQIHKDAATAP